MKRTNKVQEGGLQFRFYKSNLAKIVWHPTQDKVMANFVNGSFITSDKKVARILLDKGYPQIPVDAEEPPDVLVRIPGKSLDENENVKVGGISPKIISQKGVTNFNGVKVPTVVQ